MYTKSPSVTMSPPLIAPLTGTSHLKPTNQNPLQREDPQRLKFPSPEQRVQQRRPKVYRLVFHSDDRVAGTPTAATFDLGDLRGAWGLNDNLDAGKVHYLCKVDTFAMTTAEEADIEIRADGFPVQRESWDSRSRGSSDLLGVAIHKNTEVYATNINASFTLTSLPSGRVTVRLEARRRPDGTDVQAALRGDTTVQWQLVLSITPEA